MNTNIATLEDIVYSVAETFGSVLTDKSIEFKREAEFALQVLYGNDYSRKIAMQNPQSVRDSVTNIAAIGISLNPAKKQAYLVPRKGGIVLVISYIGMVELAVSSGSILWAKAEIVREADRFTLNGLDKMPSHEFSPFAKDRGEAVGVYCVAKTRDGDYLTDTMSIGEVNAIRDRSDAWLAWVNKQKKCPWVTDPGEMQKKTILKRSAKLWPQTDRLDRAVHILNTDGGEGIDHSAEEQRTTQEPGFSVSAILARITTTDSMAELAAIRREGLTAASRTKDKAAYERIKLAVERKRAELSGQVQDVEVKEPAHAAH